MAKKKVRKQKIKKQPKILAPKALTLKEKIDKTVEDYAENKEELKKQIFGLIQRVLFPDQFCPECGDRLFFGSTGWFCTNCGFQGQSNQASPSAPQSTVRPSETRKVPHQVEKMIKATEEPRRVHAPTSKGKNIRQLVDQMDAGGPSAPTPHDESKVRRDGNVSGKINWV